MQTGLPSQGANPSITVAVMLVWGRVVLVCAIATSVGTTESPPPDANPEAINASTKPQVVTEKASHDQEPVRSTANISPVGCSLITVAIGNNRYSPARAGNQSNTTTSDRQYADRQPSRTRAYRLQGDR
jgi:hypothetical protein